MCRIGQGSGSDERGKGIPFMTLPMNRAQTPAEAIDFIRFCHRRRRVGWPEIYDEMCGVAARGLYKGWSHDELARYGITFSLAGMPALAALVAGSLGASAYAATVASAARSANVAQVRQLISSGADVNASDSSGNTALHRAMLANSKRVTEMLRAAGDDDVVRLRFLRRGGHFGGGARGVTCRKDSIGGGFEGRPQRVFVAARQRHGLGDTLPLRLNFFHLVDDVAPLR